MSKTGLIIVDLQNDYFPRYGAPEVLISDNAHEFLCELMRELLKASDVRHRTTTIYRQMSNATVERFHRTIKGILERQMTTTRSNWKTQLGPALTA